MDTIYLLEHVRAADEDDEHVKTIGVYRGEATVQAAIDRLRKQPGFRDHPDGWIISSMSLDHDSNGMANAPNSDVMTAASLSIPVGTRWCSDGLEIGCDNGETVRIAFALDCCDRKAMGHVATTGGITAEDVQDQMVATAEHRYGRANCLPQPIEWLTDNGSCYTARDTRAFARDIGLVPRFAPVSSP